MRICTPCIEVKKNHAKLATIGPGSVESLLVKVQNPR